MPPYVSEAQERWANSPSGVKALGQEKVDEFNAASKGKKLPEKAKPSKPLKPTKPKGLGAISHVNYQNKI